MRELEQAFRTHPFPKDLHILKDFEIKWPDDNYIESLITANAHNKKSGVADEHIVFSRINPGGNREELQINLPTLRNQIESKISKSWFAVQVDRWGVLRLDGRSRFNLTNDQSGGDLLSPPANLLAHLFGDDTSRAKVRALIEDAFGLYFVVDPTKLGQLRIRLSNVPPLNDEQSLNSDARNFHAAAQHIKDASDGVQAFTGIVTAVMSGEFHTILVDEPEAFLHPPLARKLGRHLASISSEKGGLLLASTHSPDFLMGCVQAAKDVRVVRLEYRDGKSRGKVVDPDQLSGFLKRPLMRSANVIAGLFHDGVVVTESDNDRAFYGEIYHRLSQQNAELPSLLFVNAQNKQTIKDIIGPLRDFGVPAAAVCDVDIVKDGGSTWTDWLRAARIPNALHAGFGQQRSTIKQLFEDTGKGMKRDGGVALLSRKDRLAAEHLFDSLAEYGIFVVRRGELEGWLSQLSVPGKKTDWTIAMLERLGSDPLDVNYIQPGNDDVWDFIISTTKWIQNPARRGTLDDNDPN